MRVVKLLQITDENKFCVSRDPFRGVPGPLLFLGATKKNSSGLIDEETLQRAMGALDITCFTGHLRDTILEYHSHPLCESICYRPPRQRNFLRSCSEYPGCSFPRRITMFRCRGKMSHCAERSLDLRLLSTMISPERPEMPVAFPFVRLAMIACEWFLTNMSLFRIW